MAILFASEKNNNFGRMLPKGSLCQIVFISGWQKVVLFCLKKEEVYSVYTGNSILTPPLAAMFLRN